MKKLLLFLLVMCAALSVEAQPTERIYLSGTDVEHPRTWEFYCSAGQNGGAWRTIEVPSCWEQQGYGAYTYGRFYRTKGLKPSTETGRYRTTFKAPKGGHYPSDRHFLEACDPIGLLYFDELPGWQTRYDNETAARIVEEFIASDVNYPSIYLWSNGNEGGWNRSIDHRFAELDIQKRKVVHPWSDFQGIDTHHYPAYQTGIYRLQNGQNVFMPTEFLHGRYDRGQGAALENLEI